MIVSSAYQTKCPVCHLILRDQWEATCCAYSFLLCTHSMSPKERQPLLMVKERQLWSQGSVNVRHSLKRLKVFCSYIQHRWLHMERELQVHLDKINHSSESLQYENSWTVLHNEKFLVAVRIHSWPCSKLTNDSLNMHQRAVMWNWFHY